MDLPYEEVYLPSLTRSWRIFSNAWAWIRRQLPFGRDKVVKRLREKGFFLDMFFCCCKELCFLMKLLSVVLWEFFKLRFLFVGVERWGLAAWEESYLLPLIIILLNKELHLYTNKVNSSCCNSLLNMIRIEDLLPLLYRTLHEVQKLYYTYYCHSLIIIT